MDEEEYLLRYRPERTNIILIGDMGVGKSTVAPLLAAALSMGWCDTDSLIKPACGHSGTDLIARGQESKFRKVEEQVTLTAMGFERVVIATGAGAWCSRKVVGKAFNRAISIWLQGDFSELLRRVKASNRVLAQRHDLADFLKRQQAERSSFYDEADLELCCDNKAPEKVRDELVKLITEFRGEEMDW